MNYLIDRHNLNLILEEISKNFLLYGYQNNHFKKLDTPYRAQFFQQNSLSSFKKIIYKNGQEIAKENKQKIALIGINPCDNNALNIFHKQFDKSNLAIPRNELFVFVSQCQQNEYCFCEYFNAQTINNYDLYLQQEEDNKLTLFCGSKKGFQIISKMPLKKSKLKKPRPIDRPKNHFKRNLSKVLDDKLAHLDFLTQIANNCFGCASCSVVCPLCFCFRQIFDNKLDGDSKHMIRWDSCFNKEFSEIQNHLDMRPKNIDRLYNWYHHKLVRGPRELNKPLCVGCGRCIQACPAHLNQKNIMESLADE